MKRCKMELVELYAYGELAESGMRAVREHVTRCLRCATELDRLNLERMLLREGSQKESALAPNFEDVFARATEASRAARTWRMMSGAASCAAAAFAVICLFSRTPTQTPRYERDVKAAQLNEDGPLSALLHAEVRMIRI